MYTNIVLHLNIGPTKKYFSPAEKLFSLLYHILFLKKKKIKTTINLSLLKISYLQIFIYLKINFKKSFSKIIPRDTYASNGLPTGCHFITVLPLVSVLSLVLPGL